MHQARRRSRRLVQNNISIAALKLFTARIFSLLSARNVQFFSLYAVVIPR